MNRMQRWVVPSACCVYKWSSSMEEPEAETYKLGACLKNVDCGIEMTREDLMGSLHLEGEWEEGLIRCYVGEVRAVMQWIFVSDNSFHLMNALPLGELSVPSITSIRKWWSLEQGFELLPGGELLWLGMAELPKAPQAEGETVTLWTQSSCWLRGLSVLGASAFSRNYSPKKTAGQGHGWHTEGTWNNRLSVAPRAEALRAKAWLEKIPFGW